MSDQSSPSSAFGPSDGGVAPPAEQPASAVPTPVAPSAAVAAEGPAPAEQPAPEPAPTIGDHAERLGLKPWQVKAVIARLHGQREKGAPEVTETTRMSAEDFDAALDEALHGRV